MEAKKALTISFTVDKDNLMENQLRIPTKYLSRECVNLDRKVSWTTLAGCKTRRCSSQLKNGRKPRLVLTDVLKTDLGKAYVEKIKLRQTKGNRGGVRNAQRERGRCQEETLSCRDRRSARRDVRRDNNESITPKCNQKITSHTPQRCRGTSEAVGKDEGEEVEEHDDIPEVIVGEDYTYTEIVDCGLSVTWKPTEEATEDKLSPSNIKDGWTGPPCRLQNSLKKRRGDHELHCNGTGSTRGLRRSVLRLSEVGKDGAPARKHICVEEGGNVGELYSADTGILQFTVGEDDDQRGILIPVTRSHMETGETIESRTRSSSRDGKSKTGPSEPIVLSSDDDEDNSGGIPQLSRLGSVVTVEDVLTQKQPMLHAVNTQHGGSDIQDVELLHLMEDDTPAPMASNFGSPVAYPCMGVAFSTLRCGRYQGKANGDVMIVDQRIIIPVKDTNEQVKVTLTLERKEVKRFSIWEKEEMELRGLHYHNKDEPPPPAVLLLNVSETAAAVIHWDLRQLPVRKSDARFADSASPFLLLSLKDPMRGIAGAVLRSLLEMDFFSSLEQHTTGQGVVSRLEDLETPVISLDDSLELIRKTGLDPLLLSLLSGASADSGPDSELDSRLSDTEEKTTTQNELALELEEEPDTGLNPTGDQEEQEAELPSEESREVPTPVYMVCHRRIKGNYSVTLSQPDSRWTQYKYQGLTSRLIQFPPPPLKGGITVTMEDLQCLDNGHFLNDVIIDFYLKYLLQNAPAAMVERCHIFSSFFYKQLTRRDNASESNPSETCQRQRRHQRVKTWTRHIDIFKKDFVFVPVNQEAHWYLVVICFPGLNDPCLQAWAGLESQIGNSHEEFQEEDDAKTPKSLDNPEGSPPSDHNESLDTAAENAEEDSTKEPGTDPVNCTEQTCQMKYVCKRPCILVMDSLKLSSHERVFKLLREYLQSEWEVRRGSSRLFSPEQMKGSHCKVPKQDNSSDCGLYLLQYVESFLKDPVVHFDLPLCLESWFPRQQVRRKRDEIRDLVLNLYRQQNLDNVR